MTITRPVKGLRAALAAGALLLVGVGELRAQQDWWWAVTWQLSTQSSLPSSADLDTNFVEDFSFRGVGFEGRYFPRNRDNLSFGIATSWNVLNEEIRGETVSLPGADLTADTQLRTVNAFPILATSHLYFGERGGVRPYVGVGAGAYFIERRAELSIIAVDSGNWHFGWAPEAGIAVPLHRDLVLLGNARYNWAFSSGESGDQQYWSFGLGLAYR